MIYALLFTHFVADFLLQSDWMAINKSTSWRALTVHVLLYSVCFLWLGPMFTLITFLTHFATDAITSRATAYLYKKNERHWFFVVIGLDQLIHQFTLLYTWEILR